MSTITANTYSHEIGTAGTGGATYSTGISAIATKDYVDQPKNSLVFNVDGYEVAFEGPELIRLREMLTEWIKNNHPEDLL